MARLHALVGSSAMKALEQENRWFKNLAASINEPFARLKEMQDKFSASPIQIEIDRHLALCRSREEELGRIFGAHRAAAERAQEQIKLIAGPHSTNPLNSDALRALAGMAQDPFKDAFKALEGAFTVTASINQFIERGTADWDQFRVLAESLENELRTVVPALRDLPYSGTGAARIGGKSKSSADLRAANALHFIEAVAALLSILVSILVLMDRYFPDQEEKIARTAVQAETISLMVATIAGELAERDDPESATLFVATAEVRLRTAPSTDSEVIAVVQKGGEFKMTGQKDDWLSGFAVTADGAPTPGWVHSDYLVASEND